MSEWEKGKRNQYDFDNGERKEVAKKYLIDKVPAKDLMEEYDISRDSIRRWSRKFGPELQYPLVGVPDGHTIKGVSALIDHRTGEKMLEWVKTNKDAEQIVDSINEVAEALRGDIDRQAPIKSPNHTNKDLLSTYVLTDYHFGQMASEAEVGEAWDMEIAEEMLMGWFTAAISAAPDSHTAILCQLGDFLHYDSLEAMTPTSGHILDASERYGPIIKTIIRVLRQVVDMLLEKHERVHILMAEGNHDIASSVWLRMLFGEKYADDPRVTVDETHTPFYAYEWGNTSLFFHHGHKARIGKVAEVMTANFREIYGRTKYSYAHMGHYHHRDMKEERGMVVEQHPTLAAKDAHSARGGYVSQRNASVITYSKTYGEVSRVTVSAEMVKQAA